MKTIDVEIEGIAALLQHRYPIEEQGENKKAGKKKNYVPVEEAEKACFRDKETGELFEPSEHIFGALTRTASGFNYDKKKTYKDVIKSGVLIEPDNLLLGTKSWDEIDTRRAVVQRGAVVRWRPRFNKWKLSFRIKIVDEDNLSVRTVREILDKAGSSCGIGDYRPRFGRFQVTKWEEQK